jgi:hypothetical protein
MQVQKFSSQFKQRKKAGVSVNSVQGSTLSSVVVVVVVVVIM